MIPQISDVLNNLIHYTSPATVRKNHKELYDAVINLPYDNFSKKLHAFYHGAPAPCPICGKPTKYVNFRLGYRKYCSNKCAMCADETTVARKLTNKTRYGVELPAQSEKIRQKMAATNLKRYGTKYAIQNKFIKERAKQTNLAKYGVEWTGGLKQRLEKAKQTNLAKYGVEWYLCTEEFAKRSNITKIAKYGSATYHNVEKAKQTRWNKTAQKYGALQYDGYKLTMPCGRSNCNKCQEKTYSISLNMYMDRCKYGCECCTKLFPPHSMDYGVSAASQMLFQTLDTTLFEGFDTFYHQKNKEYIIDRYKLDYYVPEIGICVEFYGDYWHANPLKFAANDIPIPQFHKTAQEIWEHDEERIKSLNERGINVIIVWASEFQAGAAIDSIIQQLEEFLSKSDS